MPYWCQFIGPNLVYTDLMERGAAVPLRKERPFMYEIEFVRGHVEVYLDGVFCFSADTRGEAEREIEQLTA